LVIDFEPGTVTVASIGAVACGAAQRFTAYILPCRGTMEVCAGDSR
jgi:hypothetical protein